ncbi:hypothetical protein [Mesorhizobium sp. CO1-1-4]|uniref:hypothetical protein n=2 Tax=unclassified Mesorhizobium TaxID=325217 RepID=UPI001CCB3AD6|nr:hypothetical protein [Mesorhizobium sp. CO1-1-4]MBZ9741698.1 hypothetical protein [Mesorhizobium sp. CO1-1-4]
MVSPKRRPAPEQTIAPLSRTLLRSAGFGLLMTCAAVTARAESTTTPAAEPTAPPAAEAAAASTDPVITGSLERHWTNNALDSDRNVSDWYSLLRGALQQQWGDSDAYAKLNADFQVSHYDHTSIEDDRSLGVSAEAFRRLTPGLELRGTLSYRVSSTGDNLDIGPLTLGTREAKQVFGAQTQLGIDLGNATSLILEAADSFEKLGATHFEDDLILPAKLHADRNLFQLAARITRTVGNFAFGGSASALFASVERIGYPPLFLSFDAYTLRAEAAYKGSDGSTLGLALGAEFLRGADNIYQRWRPTWQVTFGKPLPRGFELRGTYFGRYETSNTDDPLASWLQRAELEIGTKLRENLGIASGIFYELKDNLLYENQERRKGIYAEATYDASKSMAIVLRVDINRTIKTVIDDREHSIDAFIALRAKI